MLARVLRCAIVGLDGVLVGVDVGQGVPGLMIVGLPDTAVQESRERVHAAICNSGAKFPLGCITVKLPRPISARRDRLTACRSPWASCSPPVRSWPTSIGCW